MIFAYAVAISLILNFVDFCLPIPSDINDELFSDDSCHPNKIQNNLNIFDAVLKKLSHLKMWEIAAITNKK